MATNLSFNDLLVIDNATANVGVGTTAPNDQVHIYKATSTALKIQAAGSTSVSRLRLVESSTLTSNLGAVLKYTNNTDTMVLGFNDGSSDGDVLSAVRSGASASSVNLLTSGLSGLFIDSTQRVGINTTGPTAQLDVLKNGVANIVQARSDTQALFRLSVGTVVLDVNATTVAAELRTLSNHGIQFTTNSLSRLVLSAGGDLTLGNAAVDAERWFVFTGAGTARDYGVKFGANRALWTSTSYSAATLLGSSNTERLRIESDGTFYFRRASDAGNNSIVFNTTVLNALSVNSSGYVGIGTASASNQLHINATNPIVRLQGSTDSAYLDYNGTRLQVSAGGGYLQFVTGNVNRWAIDANGALYPNTDDTAQLGAQSSRVSYVYARRYVYGSGVINVKQRGAVVTAAAGTTGWRKLATLLVDADDWQGGKTFEVTVRRWYATGAGVPGNETATFVVSTDGYGSTIGTVFVGTYKEGFGSSVSFGVQNFTTTGTGLTKYYTADIVMHVPEYLFYTLVYTYAAEEFASVQYPSAILGVVFPGYYITAQETAAVDLMPYTTPVTFTSRGGSVGIGTAAPSAYGNLTSASDVFVQAAGNGGYLRLAGNSNEGIIAANQYYSAVQKAVIGGYAPQIELMISDGSLRFSTSNSVLGDAPVTPSEIMRLTAAGILGIGASSPTVGFKLDVRGSARIEVADPRLDLVGTYRTFLTQVVDGANAAASYWRLFDNTAGTTVERVRVTSTGNVGIGNTSPNSPAANVTLAVGVEGSSSVQNAIRIYGGNDANRAPVLSLFRSGNIENIVSAYKSGAVAGLALGVTGGIASYSDATLAASCQLFLTSAGKLGLNVAEPDTLIEARGTDAGIVVHHYSNSRGGIYAFSTQRVAFASTNSADNLVFGYTGSPGTSAGFVEKARLVNASGNFGVGTTSPGERLTVSAGSNDRIGADVAGVITTITLGSTISAEALRTIAFDRSTGLLHVKYGINGSALTSGVLMDSSGFVGIGTTAAPSYRFVTRGNAAADEVIARVDNGNATVTAFGYRSILEVAGLNNGGTYTRLRLQAKGGGTNFADFVATEVGTPDNAPLNLFTNNTTRMVVDSAGSVTVASGGNLNLANGNLIIGTSGKGIDFSATPGTGTQELLDDYEEGDWTPSLSSSGGTLSGTGTGRYTKVGRLVTVQYSVQAATVSSATGNVFINSLPFTSSAAGYGQGVSSYAEVYNGVNWGTTFAHCLATIFDGGSTNLTIYRYDTSHNWQFDVATKMSILSIISGTFSYITDS